MKIRLFSEQKLAVEAAAGCDLLILHKGSQSNVGAVSLRLKFSPALKNVPTGERNELVRQAIRRF
jgi:hypothetical protein